MRKTTPYVEPTATCSIERSVEVLGERWTFLILRQAHGGTTRFADFRDELGIAPDVLAARLEKLVAAGVMERREYKAPGERARLDYHLTQAGVDLRVVLGALQQWGDFHLPKPGGPTMLRRDSRTGKSVGVAFVDDEGQAIATEDVYLVNPSEAD
jgi:DNA-binding HxlR family transcriptional regulator